MARNNSSRSTSRRPLRFDRLEARENPAGVVTAVQAGDVLILTGDDLDNVIQVRNVNNFDFKTPVHVVGLNGTKIGDATSKDFTDVRSIKIAMNGGDDSVLTDPATGEFEFFGSVNIDLGDGNNTLTLDPSGRLVTDKLTVKAGDGFDTVTFTGNPGGAEPDFLVTPTLDLGDGGAAVSMTSFETFGAIKIKAGAGAESVSLTNVVLQVENTTDKFAPFTAQLGDGPATIDLSPGVGELKMGGMTVKAAGDVTVRTTGPVTVGSMTVDAGTGRANVILDAGAPIKGDVSVRGAVANLGVGSGDGLSVDGSVSLVGRFGVGLDLSVAGASRVGRNLAVQSVDGDATVDARGTGLDVDGNLSVSAAAETMVNLGTSGPSKVKGNVSVRGGYASDLFDANAQFTAGKNLTLALAGGSNAVALTGVGAEPNVAGNLMVTTGAGEDTVLLDHMHVGGKMTIQTGAGADRLEIRSGGKFVGPTLIDLGAGDDTMLIGVTPPIPGSGAVTFQGKMTAKLGAGNDKLTLGTSGGGADGQVVFGAAGNGIDGGLGRDLFDAQAGQFESTKIKLGSVDDPTP